MIMLGGSAIIECWLHMILNEIALQSFLAEYFLACNPYLVIDVVL